MSMKKVCKQCNMIYEGSKCPGCGNQEYSEEIKGRVLILDSEKSEIAKKVAIKKNGEYAIKSR